MTEGIAYCVNCKAVTIHKDGKCMFCEGENKIYDNIFHDPNVQALRRDRNNPNSWR